MYSMRVVAISLLVPFCFMLPRFCFQPLRQRFGVRNCCPNDAGISLGCCPGGGTSIPSPAAAAVPKDSMRLPSWTGKDNGEKGDQNSDTTKGAVTF